MDSCCLARTGLGACVVCWMWPELDQHRGFQQLSRRVDPSNPSACALVETTAQLVDWMATGGYSLL